MNYTEAIRIKKTNGHLIGELYKGARIDEIVIYPKSDQDSFIKDYILSNDAEKSLIPYMQHNDLHVAVVCDKSKINLGWIVGPFDLELIDGAKL